VRLAVEAFYRWTSFVAFVFEEGGKYVAFVVVESTFVSYYIKRQVLLRLEKFLGPNIYTADNVCLSSTHSHS
jgi:hypothetical protein